MDAILGEITLTRRRRKLDDITNGAGLEDVYTVTLSQMGAQQRNRAKLGIEVLMWVSHSERPLHVDELRHALGVGGSIDLDGQNIPAIETLLACTLGLIMVEKSSSAVRLVHYTLQEYLSQNLNLFRRPHSMIAEVCLTYLNFPHVRGLSPFPSSVPLIAPFIGYASCHWGTHARRGKNQRVKSLALKLLDEFDKHISSKILLCGGLPSWQWLAHSDYTARGGLTGRHGAAYFGCVEITVALLETNRWDVEATDFEGNTAMAWAARGGHEGVVKILLEQNDVNPNRADTQFSQTPLMWATRNGHEGVMRILLERNDVNPDTADQWGQTPLLWAAENGDEGVVRILLEENKVNPNRADTQYDRTPLVWATSSVLSRPGPP